MLSGFSHSAYYSSCFWFLNNLILVFFYRAESDVPLAADVKGVRMHMVERMVSGTLSLHAFLVNIKVEILLYFKVMFSRPLISCYEIQDLLL